MRGSRTTLTLGFLACLTLGVAHCGDSEIAKADLEQGAQKALTESVGKPAPPITCPSGLKAKVGASIVCSVTLTDKPYDVTVAVTSIEGGAAKYSVEVASKPHGT